MKKYMKVMIVVVLLFVGVIILDHLTTYKSTTVNHVLEEDQIIYIDTSTTKDHTKDSYLIEIEEGIYKVESKKSMLYGDDHQIVVDNKDHHVKEIRSYRNDYDQGYRIVYPIDSENYHYKEIIMIKDDQTYEFNESHSISEFIKRMNSYIVCDGLSEYEMNNHDYVIVLKDYDDIEYRYILNDGYLMYEKNHYVYQVNDYNDLINYLNNKFS